MCLHSLLTQVCPFVYFSFSALTFYLHLINLRCSHITSLLGGKGVCSEVSHDAQQVQGRPFLRTFPSFFKAEDNREFRAAQHLPNMSSIGKLPIIFTTKGVKQKLSQYCAYFSLERDIIK